MVGSRLSTSLHLKFRSSLLAALLVFSATDAVAGSAPYASLYRALEPGLKLDRYDRLLAVQRIQSKLAEVPPGTITVRILARGGAIDVPIGADGRMRFPLTSELLAENPVVESNQPSGSLSLSVSFEVAPPAGSNMAYTDFLDSVRQAQEALRQLDGPYAKAEVVGLEFRMGGPDASATVACPDSEDLLRADQKGRIVVRIDPRLPPADTAIHFSDAPRQAFPNLRMPQ